MRLTGNGKKRVVKTAYCYQLVNTIITLAWLGWGHRWGDKE
jgi:hypothetical protein